MAWLEKRGDRYRIKFRFGGQNLSVALKTGKEHEAESSLVRFEENLRLVERGRMELPPDAEVGPFLLSDGKVGHSQKPVAVPLTLQEVFDVYRKHLTAGTKEANTRTLEAVHMKHLLELLGKKTPITQITTVKVQRYVDRRATDLYRERTIKPQTIKKEVATLQTIWNWAERRDHIAMPYPVKGLTFPKGGEKPPFRTFDQIKEIIGRSELKKYEIRELWDGLFLDKGQIAELLDHVKSHAPHPWVYAFFVAVAHTGARRSEMLRAQVEDFDFTNRVVQIREKKRSRLRDTFRTVDMTQLLGEVMQNYFQNHHPGGANAFSEELGKPLAQRRTRTIFLPALRGSPWVVLRGYHAFRHSFASNLAAAGIDEHVIAALMGHLTGEMRARYRHLFPSQRRAAVASVFG
jgi:integrase